MTKKTLKITGNSGLIDLLGVLEYGIDIVQSLNYTIDLSICWSRWEQTFDQLIKVNLPITYTPFETITKKSTVYKIHANEKKVDKNTPLTFYNELFNQYDIIELWDNRNIAGNYPTVNLFNKIQFSPVVHEQLNICKNILGEKYIGFHGRFTDFPHELNYIQKFKNTIIDVINNTKYNVALCTDNQQLISEFLHNERVYNFSYAKDLLLHNIIIPKQIGLHQLTKKDIPEDNLYYNLQLSSIIDMLLCIDSHVFFLSLGSWGDIIKKIRESKQNYKNYNGIDLITLNNIEI